MMHRVKPPEKGTPDTLARSARGAASKQGKVVALALLVAVLVVGGLLLWVAMSGTSTHVPPSKPGVGFTPDLRDPAGGSGASEGNTTNGPSAWDGAAITKTMHDPKVREELRKRILAGWAAEGEGEQASAAREGRFVPAPEGPDGGRMDPKYIQEVVRGEFFPMAEKCYDELRTRNDAASGRVEMSFTIVADEKLGGIVDDVGVVNDGGLADERMTTCMRESMTAMAFRPPAHGGYVTVVYPIDFSSDEDGPDR
jgi:hypothetical protein